MSKFSSYLRVLAIMSILFFAAEYFIDSGDKPAIIAYPLVSVFLVLILLLLVAIESSIAAIDNVLFQVLSPEKKKAYLEKKAKNTIQAKMQRMMASMTKAKPIAQEDEIILDHNYDGIQELDNTLPPWWVYGFYMTIIFAFIYVLKYQVFNGDNQVTEYEKAVAQAKIDIEEYKKTAKDLVDFNTVTLLTDATDISAGQKIFKSNCVACHAVDGGGGIGPNLTDAYWILGGGIKNIFKTISEGGRDGKGMVAWKQSLKPSEIQQVASYIVSLEGSTPANAKKAQGEIWQDPNKPKQQEKTIAMHQ